MISCSQHIIKHLGQQWVAVEQPAAKCNSICFVIKFFRIYFIKMIQFIFLKYFAVERCHAIHTETIMNVDMCHMNRIVFIYNIYSLICIFSSYLVIQHFYNRNKLRSHFFEIFNRPFFQRFRQNGVVCVRTGA